MSTIGISDIIDHAPQDNPNHLIASTKPASQEAVAAVIGYDPDLPDGLTRSEWLWIRLTNGDLILGVFPQDEGYFTHEQEHSS